MRPALGLLVVLALSSTVRAQSGKGFALDRYEPTSAGQWSVAVDHPWFSRGPNWYDGLAAGLTLDYSHNPLVLGTRSASGINALDSVVRHQLVGHFDLSFYFLNRVGISLSLPVVLMEKGTAAGGISPEGVNLGDVRVGAAVRLWKAPMHDPFSLSLAADLWIPVGTADEHAGDSGVRASPRLILAGLSHHVMWSATGGYEYAPLEQLGDVGIPGNYAASEMRFGASIGYADLEQRFEAGPEATYAAQVTGPEKLSRNGSYLELLLGAHYNVARAIDIGAAGGIGIFGSLGTPDARAIFRVAYAPMAEAPNQAAAPAALDRDRDGIADADDACPDEPGVASANRSRNGCPSGADADNDGVPDEIDQCPAVPTGKYPDAKRRGCPMADGDTDGVPDVWDRCPNEPAGAHPDPARPGCPARDSDNDGVYDPEDLCPNAPSGPHPDLKRPGCPLPDRDADGVPDALDACPDEFGVADSNPKKSGCPALSQIAGNQIKVGEPIRFRGGSSRLLPASFPVLQSLADALTAHPEIAHLTIEGYTDARGRAATNLRLSRRRAQAVRSWLIEQGIAATRLSAQGFGAAHPISSNATATGRAENRRVEFHIDTP